jgi:hypothetical protein
VQVAAVVVGMAGQMLAKAVMVAAVVEVGQKLPDGLTQAQQERQTEVVEVVEVVTQTLLMVYFLVEAAVQVLLLFRYPQETIPVHLRDHQQLPL